MKKTFDKSRPLSWSAISAFEYNPEQWYEKYVLGKKSTSPEMVFGSKIGKLLETDPSFLPEIPRQKHMEYKFEAEIDGVKLVGFADSFCDEQLILEEYKTGVKPWDQKRADNHGQIDMYLFMLYMSKGIKPELVRCRVHWMPTTKTFRADLNHAIDFDKKLSPVFFETRRTTRDILQFGVRIKKTLEAMEEYCQNHE